MSRFLSRAGSSIDALHRQLSRRSTVDDTTTRQPGHLPPHIEETPPTPRMTIPSRRAFGSSPPQTSSGLFSRSPLSTSPLSTHSQSRQPPISSPPTNDASTSSPLSTRRSRFNFSPTLPSIPAGNTFTTFRTMVTQNYGSIVPTWTVSKNPPTVVKSSSSVHSAPSDTASPPRLETFDGVFVPTVLSIWGIILFLRFGFIIAQAGVMGTLGMFGLGYLVNILTTLSLSAISTNGTVRGGGPYYLISRSLGPEFGGSIGLVFYLGNLICGSMSVLGFVEPLLENFGRTNGELIRIFPEGPWWGFAYGMVVLIICTVISLMGSKPYARTSVYLAAILLISTISIFISFLFKSPFRVPEKNINYTGFRLATLRENLWPKFTVAPVAGNEGGSPETFQSVFSVLFPACNGILAGAQLSGDLRDPSKSIPKGTLTAVAITYVTYSIIVILMGGSIDRASMYNNLNIFEDVSVIPILFTAGALAASVYAVLGAVIGSAKILQAIARDRLLPILTPFKQGTVDGDEPVYGVIFTFFLTLAFCFIPSINALAAFVTMAMLLTFGILNLACFLLKISSAPNFRPSFRFFKWWTAALGFTFSIGTMIIVDQVYAFLSMGFMLTLFVWIHYQSPPKSWGDVTQSLIYHQVRKYLLRLDSRKEHVKFWRPQILLLVNNPRTNYQMIQFCNSLKKGALYVLGHVLEGEFRDLLPEFKYQQNAWLRFVDDSKIKAFVQITIADNERLGARNLVLGSGLGGMRPNIVVLGSFDLAGYRVTLENAKPTLKNTDPVTSVPAYDTTSGSSARIAAASPVIRRSDEAKIDFMGPLPTDTCRVETPIKATDYVGIIEDVLSLNKAVAIGFGFRNLEGKPLKSSKMGWLSKDWFVKGWFAPVPAPGTKKYIDLWPMQVSADVIEPSSANTPNVTMTNFDTYTMVLQMGTILHMVPYWKEHYILRVICFVEYHKDVEEHRRKVGQLLEILRIRAELLVLWLDGAELKSYDAIVRQEAGVDERVDFLMVGTEWWTQQVERKQAAAEYALGTRQNVGAVPVRRSQTLAFGATPVPVPVQRSTRKSRDRAGSLPITFGMRINMSLPDPDDIDISSGEDDDDELFGRSPSSHARRMRRLQSRAAWPQRLSWAGNEVLNEEEEEEENEEEEEDVIQPVRGRHTSVLVQEPESHFWPVDEPHRPTSSRSSSVSSTHRTQPTSTDSSAPSSWRPPVFDELPSRAQNLILNDLMRRHSCADKTAIVFSTLPAPVIGTSTEEAAFSYLENLETLVEGLPPVLLIHAKSMTVTVSL